MAKIVLPARGKKALLTAYVPLEVAEAVMARAEKLGWAASKTAGEIIEQWHRAGCPALTELERQADKAKSGSAKP